MNAFYLDKKISVHISAYIIAFNKVTNGQTYIYNQKMWSYLNVSELLPHLQS